MKNKSPKPVAKTSRKQTNVSGQEFIPPAYGVNFVDKQSNSNDATVQCELESSPRETFSVESDNKNSTAISSKARPNNTGLPDDLKTKIENLSGYSMDDVKVHFNSDKPARLHAHAYAQGTDIHLASGQEKHLPHEAWHVVQQKQGRVKPTRQINGEVNVNDDDSLEKEADGMGMKASENEDSFSKSSNTFADAKTLNAFIVQRQVPPQGDGNTKEIPNTVYTARGGENTPYDKDAHPRSKFNFGGQTRNAVFGKYNPQFAGNRIISIRSSSGEQVNVEGVQLDHQISWNEISSTMDAKNKILGAGWNSSIGYSLWDAKMYYNDIDNLVPALGAINASAGELGVNEIPRIHKGLEIYQGNIQTAWMNLQAGLVAVGQGISDENAVRIANLLHEITTAMNDVTEEIL